MNNSIEIHPFSWTQRPSFQLLSPDRQFWEQVTHLDLAPGRGKIMKPKGEKPDEFESMVSQGSAGTGDELDLKAQLWEPNSIKAKEIEVDGEQSWWDKKKKSLDAHFSKKSSQLLLTLFPQRSQGRRNWSFFLQLENVIQNIYNKNV